MDIPALENELNTLDNIKLQKLLSWLTHEDIAVIALLFSETTKQRILDNTSKGGRKIVTDEMNNLQDSYEDKITETLGKTRKYIDLIIAGKGIDYIDD